MSSPQILIVDDEINIRLMLRTILEGEGYLVDEASNGREALQRIEQKAYALVLLDLNMPVLDGMAVLEALNARKGPSPAVIVLTAYGSISVAVRATRLGAVDFLEKPITPDELRVEVRGVLAEREANGKASAVEGETAGGYDGVLERVRVALRGADRATAETLLMRAADLSAGREAPYFNLLGVLYEIQRNWRLAKKFYQKAMRADRAYGPAETNVRRIYELESFGRTVHAIALGDEKPPTALEQLLHERHPERPRGGIR
jgi:CheY-like chemotaxis protein